MCSCRRCRRSGAGPDRGRRCPLLLGQWGAGTGLFGVRFVGAVSPVRVVPAHAPSVTEDITAAWRLSSRVPPGTGLGRRSAGPATRRFAAPPCCPAAPCGGRDSRILYRRGEVAGYADRVLRAARPSPHPGLGRFVLPPWGRPETATFRRTHDTHSAPGYHFPRKVQPCGVTLTPILIPAGASDPPKCDGCTQDAGRPAPAPTSFPFTPPGGSTHVRCGWTVAARAPRAWAASAVRRRY